MKKYPLLLVFIPTLVFSGEPSSSAENLIRTYETIIQKCEEFTSREDVKESVWLESRAAAVLETAPMKSNLQEFKERLAAQKNVPALYRHILKELEDKVTVLNITTAMAMNNYDEFVAAKNATGPNRILIQSYIEDYVSSIDSVLTQILVVKEKEKKAYEKAIKEEESVYKRALRQGYSPDRVAKPMLDNWFNYVSIFKEKLPKVKDRLESELAKYDTISFANYSGDAAEKSMDFFRTFLYDKARIPETPLLDADGKSVGNADITEVLRTFIWIKNKFNLKTEITIPEFLEKNRIVILYSGGAA